MNVFEKILDRLEEQLKNTRGKYARRIGNTARNWERIKAYQEVIKIVREVAEEYSRCDTDILCDECDTYDKEKHYCSKYCPVIRGTLRELKENDNT